MKLIKESDIDYILAPIAPVLKGEKVHYEWIAFRKQIDELQGISPLANRSIFRYVFADETSIELLDVGLSEESKEKLEEIHGKANVEKINPSIPDKKMPLICLRCKKPILLPMSTVVVLSYTHYSYCEDCLRKGLKLLKAQDEAQADGEYNMFKVIDTKTGKEPTDRVISNIAKRGNLIECDIDQFFVGEDGSLVLMDDCGNISYVDTGRFKVKWEGNS